MHRHLARPVLTSLCFLLAGCSGANSTAQQPAAYTPQTTAVLQSQLSQSTSPAQTLYAASETYAGTTDTGPVLQAFDVETGASRAEPSLASAAATAIATSDAGRFVYLGTANGIVVLDESTGHAVSYDMSASIASVTQTATAATLFFSDGQNSVFVFDGRSGAPLRTLSVPNSGPISVDPTGARLYVATPSRRAVSVVSAATGRAFYTVSLPATVSCLAVDTATNELFAPALNERKAYVVDLNARKYSGYLLEPTAVSATQIVVQPNSRAFYLGMPYAQTIVKYAVDARGVPQVQRTYHVPGVNGAYGNGLSLDVTGAHVFGIGNTSVYEAATATGQIVRSFPEPPNNGGFATSYVGIAISQ